MKVFVRIASFLLALILCLAVLPACDGGAGSDTATDTAAATSAPTAAPTEAATEAPEPRLTVDGSWRIVISAEADEVTRRAAEALAAALRDKAGLELATVTDAEAPAPGELVLGRTNRDESTAVESGYALFLNENGLCIDAGNTTDLYYAVRAILEVWLTPEFGLAEAGALILPESRIPELNGLATLRENSITVLSQNLRCADDPNGNSISARFRRFMGLFEEYQPDLLGTQETTPQWNKYLERIGGADYGMVGCSREGREATTGEWNTILYRKDRFELLDSDTTWLSDTPNEPSRVEGALCHRICTWALLKDKVTGETILFANTHLDHSNDEVRSAQMDILMDYLADRIGQYPFYLTGDFNCQVDSLPYGTVTDRLVDSHKSAWVDLSTEERTYHAYQPDGGSEIDFIFHNDHTTPVRYEIISKDYDGFVSDHYGVVVEFVNDKG